ncbi:PISD isoform 3 [Pongo abelii]|uniref:PISD isoform 3 n=1 Tax=Pongo abelii TaxID=9601 RepID=A0A2J8UVH2_PONAB|nr:PISD isoform 3 [Pongo abelii]
MATSVGHRCLGLLHGVAPWRSRCQKNPHCPCPNHVPAASRAHSVGNRWRVCRVPAV